MASVKSDWHQRGSVGFAWKNKLVLQIDGLTEPRRTGRGASDGRNIESVPLYLRFLKKKNEMRSRGVGRGLVRRATDELYADLVNENYGIPSRHALEVALHRGAAAVKTILTHKSTL
jgi:hypothetical protein